MNNPFTYATWLFVSCFIVFMVYGFVTTDRIDAMRNRITTLELALIRHLEEK